LSANSERHARAQGSGAHNGESVETPTIRSPTTTPASRHAAPRLGAAGYRVLTAADGTDAISGPRDCRLVVLE
jgi:hypothetical protein